MYHKKESLNTSINFIIELLRVADKDLNDLLKETDIDDRVRSKIDLAETKIDAAMSNLEAIRLGLRSEKSKTVTIDRETLKTMWDTSTGPDIIIGAKLN